MPDLLDHHLAHQVRCRPHALADLRPPGKAVLEANADIACLVGLEPGGILHLALTHHRPSVHRGVDFIARPVEEAGIDEDDAVLHRLDTGGKVRAGAAFLVHDADLDRVTRQVEQILHRVEQVIGEGAFFRPVHLGLHDVDRALAAVPILAKPRDVLRRNRAGHHCIENAFGNFPIIPAHGGIGHQMADVADEHQAASGQRNLTSVWRRVAAIGRKLAGHRPAALVEAFRQIAPDHAQPVAIGEQLVLCIDSGNRIFAIGNRRKGSFEVDIGDIRRVGLAHRMVGVEHDFDMQSVVLEEAGLVVPAHALRRVGQRDALVLHIAEVRPFAAIGQRDCLVHEALGSRDDRCAAFLIIAARLSRRGVERIGPVEGIIQAAPSRIGSIEEEARIEDRDNQLRPGHGRDLRIDILGSDREVARLRDKITDFLEEIAIIGGIVRLSGMRLVPAVDLALQILSRVEKRGIARCEFAKQRCQSLPEGPGILAQRRQDVCFDKSGKLPVDFDTGARHVIAHGTPLGSLRPAM